MNICSHVNTDDLPLPPFCRWDIRCGRRHCQLLHLASLPGASAPVGLATPSHTPRATVIWWHRGSSCWDPWRVDRPCSSKQTLLWLRISHSTTAPSRRSQRAHRALRQWMCRDIQVWECDSFILEPSSHSWEDAEGKVHYLGSFQVKFPHFRLSLTLTQGFPSCINVTVKKLNNLKELHWCFCMF